MPSRKPTPLVRVITVLSLVFIASASVVLGDSAAFAKRGAILAARQGPHLGPPVPPGPGPTTTTTSSSTTTTSSTTTSKSTSSRTTVSTPPPTTSSSTTSSSSSTSTSSTLTSLPGVTVAPLPTNTVVIPLPTDNTDAFPISTGGSGDAPEETGAATAASHSGGFFSNKAAVAGVFGIVGLIALGSIFAAVTAVMRRRRDRFDRDEFYDKYPEPEITHSRGQSAHGHVDDVSASSVVMQAPADAYPDRQIHYGGNMQSTHSNMYNSHGGPNAYHTQEYPEDPYSAQPNYAQPNYADYSYPPSATSATYAQDTHHQYDVQGHNTQGYAAAPQTPASGLNPPTAFRETVGRGDYEPEVDSFYGGPVAR